MLFAICTLVSLAIAGLSALIHAAVCAPYGVEDETGFHTTSPQEDKQPGFSSEVLAGVSGSAFFQY